jgi:hypothetical protein
MLSFGLESFDSDLYAEFSLELLYSNNFFDFSFTYEGLIV